MPNSKDLKDSEFPAELEQEETPGAAHANLLQHNDTHVYKLGTKKNRVLVIASKMEPESQPVGENAQEQPFDTKEVLSPNSKQPIPCSHTPPLAIPDILPTTDQFPQIDPVIARKTKAKVYNPNLIAKKQKSGKKVSQKSSHPEATTLISDIQKSAKNFDLEKKIDHMEKLAQSLAELLVLIESEVGSRDEFIKRFKAFSRYSTPAEFVEKSLVPLLSTAQLLHSQLTDGKIVIEPPENHASRLKTLENIILSLIFSQKVLLEYKTAPDIEKMVQNRKIEEYVAESDDYVDEIEEIRPLQYLDQLMNIIHALFIKDQPRGSKGKVLKGPSAPYPSDPFLALAAATGLDPPTIINLSPSRQKEFIMKIQKLFPNPADLMANIFEKPGSIDFHLLLYGNVDEKTRLETRVTDLEKFIAFCKQEKQQQNQIYMNIKTENDKWRPEVEALLNPDKDDEWVDEN